MAASQPGPDQSGRAGDRRTGTYSNQAPNQREGEGEEGRRRERKRAFFYRTTQGSLRRNLTEQLTPASGKF